MQDDTMISCDDCGITVWIAPRKLALRKAEECRALCYRCIFRVINDAAANSTEGFRIAVTDLDPDRDEKPRR